MASSRMMKVIFFIHLQQNLEGNLVRNLLIKLQKLEQMFLRKHQKEQFKKQQDEFTGIGSNK